MQPAEAQAAPRTEPFEISHDPAERQPEVRQAEPSEEEQNAARIQADEVVIEDIRRAEVRRILLTHLVKRMDGEWVRLMSRCPRALKTSKSPSSTLQACSSVSLVRVCAV